MTYDGTESPLTLEHLVLFDSTTEPSSLELEDTVDPGVSFSTPTPSLTPSPTQNPTSPPPPSALVAGITVAAILVLFGFAILAWVLICRRRRKNDEEARILQVAGPYLGLEHSSISQIPLYQSFYIKSRTTTGPVHVHQHQDSGVRFQAPNPAQVEIPPSYTLM